MDRGRGIEHSLPVKLRAPDDGVDHDEDTGGHSGQEGAHCDGPEILVIILSSYILHIL